MCLTFALSVAGDDGMVVLYVVGKFEGGFVRVNQLGATVGQTLWETNSQFSDQHPNADDDDEREAATGFIGTDM